MAILITGARVIDPASHTDAPLQILIEDGRITRMAPSIDPPGGCGRSCRPFWASPPPSFPAGS